MVKKKIVPFLFIILIVSGIVIAIFNAALNPLNDNYNQCNKAVIEMDDSSDIRYLPVTHMQMNSEQLQVITATNVSQIKPLEQVGHGSIKAAWWSKDGKLTVFTNLGLWQHDRIDMPAKLLWSYTDYIDQFAVSSEGSMLATTNGSNELALFDLATGEKQGDIDLRDQGVSKILLSRDGTVLAVYQNDGIHFWNTHTRQAIPGLLKSTNELFGLTISPDGKYIAASTAHSQLNGNATAWVAVVSLWSTTSTEIPLWSKEIDDLGLTDMAFSPDGQGLVLLTRSNSSESLRFWSMTTGEEYRSFSVPVAVGPQISLQFSPDDRFATYLNYVIDIESGKEIGQFGDRGSLIFSQDSKAVAVLPDWFDPVDIWDIQSASKVASIGDYNYGTGIIFASDGTLSTYVNLGLKPTVIVSPNRERLIVEGFGDATIVRLCDVSAKRQIAAYAQVGAPAFSPDGSKLATASECKIDIWDAQTGDKFTTLTICENGERSTSLVFNPIGNILAAASYQWFPKQGIHIHFWDMETQQKITSIDTGENHEIRDIAFSSDGKILTSLSQNGEIILWGVPID